MNKEYIVEDISFYLEDLGKSAQWLRRCFEENDSSGLREVFQHIDDNLYELENLIDETRCVA